MAKNSSPICFRVSDEERRMLEAAATYVGETLSTFMRHAAVMTAQTLIEQEGGDAVIQHYEEIQRRREDFSAREQQFHAARRGPGQD